LPEVHARLAQLDYQLCPHCDYEIKADYLRCPSCMRKLKERCFSCGKVRDDRCDSPPDKDFTMTNSGEQVTGDLWERYLQLIADPRKTDGYEVPERPGTYMEGTSLVDTLPR
jgi:DNA-directed RNA polymerase subunit N (RpoN/RPB10)